MSRPDFIAIEGNIGAGKTSLVHLLHQHQASRTLLEEFESNPFLEDFYREPEKYALSLELHFLFERVRQMEELFQDSRASSGAEMILADYHIEKCLIYASVNLNESDFRHYAVRFRQITSHLPQPELLVFLNNSTGQLLENIRKRGRRYESGINQKYLTDIHQKYQDLLLSKTEIPVLMIHTARLDFVNNVGDFEKINELLQIRYSKGFHEISI